MGSSDNPHQGQPVFKAGEPFSQAQAALVLLHGRGSTAQDILSLRAYLQSPGFALLAPQAYGGTWYPNRFLEPVSNNEPWLSSALESVDTTILELAGAGIPFEKIIILGFSQGGCLALEYGARHARRYGALVGFSAGLIGDQLERHHYSGSLAGTPVFLGCSDVDFHIPKFRVLESAEILTTLGGEVTQRLYPNMGHTINQDEIDHLQALMFDLVPPSIS